MKILALLGSPRKGGNSDILANEVFKGAGEAGTVGALAAVVNAVVDALAPLGVDHVDMPLTPERVWRALRGDH